LGRRIYDGKYVNVVMCFVVIVKTETETLFYGGRCFNGVALFDIFLDKKILLSKNINIFVTPP
jgi:hypothetical protein